MRGVWLGTLLLGAGLGCGPRILDLAVPRPEGARSLVLVVTREGQAPRAFAFSLPAIGEAGFTKDPLDPAERYRLYALSYSAALETLGLSPGELGLAETGNPLPPEDALHLATVEDGEASPWRESARPPELASVMLPAPSRCPSFSPRPRRLALEEVFGGGAVVNGRAVLSSTGRPELIAVDDALEERALPLAGLTFSIFAIAPLAGDRAFVGGSFGRVARVRLTDRVEIERTSVASAPSREALLWMAATGAGDELFSLSERGAFERHEGGRWRQLHRLPPATVGGARCGGVVALGPGHALAAQATPSPEILRYRAMAGREELSAERLPEADSVTAIGVTPGGRPIAAGVRALKSRLYRHDGEGWAILAESSQSVEICALAALDEDRLVVGDVTGQIRFYVVGEGWCPRGETPSPSVTLWLGVLASGHVVSGTGHTGPPGYGLLERSP